MGDARYLDCEAFFFALTVGLVEGEEIGTWNGSIEVAWPKQEAALFVVPCSCQQI